MVYALDNKTITIVTLMEASVCSMDNGDCMLRRCNACPPKDLLETLVSACCSHLQDQQEVEYKKWVATDKSTLLTVRTEPDEFVEDLVNVIYDLTSHHFTSKTQAQYLKAVKASLPPDEVLIIMDFAENYSFIVQDAAQMYHWNNSQATLHPMVVYHKPEGSGDGIVCTSYCVISDGMSHSTSAVHLFLKRLLAEVKQHMNVKSVTYFTDGAGSQYKNK